MRSFVTLFIVLSILFFNSNASAGVTGKIVGTLVDAKTGEKLVSANIRVQGLNLGASTNLDGYYVILNVPPGTYVLQATLLGYTSRKYSDVRVDIDQTTRVNMALDETAVEQTEVTVVAERPVVQRDVASSRANITTAEIEKLPTVSVSGVIALQAGVQRTSSGDLFVRGSGGTDIAGGGGSDQTVVLLDGLALRDSRNNAAFTGISISSIENVQVTTGGFEAQYGNVRSGLVNVVTKEGSRSRYSFSAITRYSPARPKHFGMSPHDPNSYWIRSYVDPAVCWTGTTNGAWDQYTQKQYQPFVGGWNAISRSTLNDSDPTNDLTPEAAQRLFLFQHRRQIEIKDPDWDIDMGFGGPMPFVSEALGDLRFYASFRKTSNAYLFPLATDGFADYTAQLKVTSDIGGGMKLSFEGFLGEQFGTNDSRSGDAGLFTGTTSVANELNGRGAGVGFIDTRMFSNAYWTPTTISRKMIGAKFAHAISATVFYNASLHWYKAKYDTNPDRLRDNRLLYKFGDAYFVDEAPFGFQPVGGSQTGVNGMRMAVGMSNSRDSSAISSLSFRFDITNQFNSYNQVQAGAEFIYVDNNSNFGLTEPAFPTSDTRNTYHTFPIQGALYLQDKIEFEGMVATLGLRLDYSTANSNWYVVSNPYDTAFTGAYSLQINSLLQQEPTKKLFNISPRLGVAFPVTDASKLFFNYGHFRALPLPENLFLVRRLTGDNRVTRLANPNLPLPRTIQYELGFEQSLFDEYLIRITGYYKDISLETKLVTYQSTNSAIRYTASTENQYRDIRGVELTLNKSRGSWIQGFVNYTYDIRTRGFFGSENYFESRRLQVEEDRLNKPQVKPVPQPFARANIDIFTPSDFGPAIEGVTLLGDLRISLVAGWSSGFYFNWSGGGGVASAGNDNNVQWKDTYGVDVRLAKGFSIGPANLQFFLDVTNLFNIKEMNNRGFIDGRDFDDYMQSLHLPAGIAGDFTDPRQRLGYKNFAGVDRPGDYRTVPYEPYDPNDPDPAHKQYVLDNKAYIDMPNQEWLAFLNPRDIFYGIRLSYDF